LNTAVYSQQLPVESSQFAVEHGPTSAKYKNVDVLLFDDKLLLAKQYKGKYYLLSRMSWATTSPDVMTRDCTACHRDCFVMALMRRSSIASDREC
jgi:hypothetical protein